MRGNPKKINVFTCGRFSSSASPAPKPAAEFAVLVGSMQTQYFVFTGIPTISTVNCELSLAMNGFWKKRTVPETPAGTAVVRADMVAVAIWKTPKLMRYLLEKLVQSLYQLVRFPNSPLAGTGI